MTQGKDFGAGVRNAMQLRKPMLRRKPMEPKSGRRAVSADFPPPDGFAAANKSAVSRVSKPAGRSISRIAPIWKSAIQQVENCATILGTPWLFSRRFVIVRVAPRTYCGVGDGVGEVASAAGDAADGFVKVAAGDPADADLILCTCSSIC